MKHPVRFGFQSGQQNVTWERMRDTWQKLDGWGYDSLWVFDHLYPIFVPDPAGPCMENWTLLGALSQHTRRARIGALVNGNTYRNPCLTAKMAATLDHLSGGRLNLGLGAGWFQLEHQSFGIDFKTVGGRLGALDESCQIIKGMFTQERTTLDGKHYKVVDAVCNPKPLQKPRIPLMIGGRGEKGLLKIVAKHADMWNTMHANPDEMKRLIGVIERHGDTVGRNTDEIEKTIMMPLCYRASKEREEMIAGGVASMARISSADARDRIMIGGKQECLDKIEQYANAGVTHFIFSLRWPIVVDDEFQAFAEEVIPAAR
ncbi:MAG TPA: TIGR03560 family F420-dependent LLM class oxidoreductase [Candidatus Binataceae bacterium]|nr:TIGR03560 family F420-dependent LLM class oxidoreductase [Candidatus Binataceae bacterium]